MTPGNRCRQARTLNNLSLRALEDRTDDHGLKIPRSTLSKIEFDQHNPSVQQIQVLCRALSMSADWWMLGDGNPSYAIGRQAEGLPEEARRFVLQTIDVLKAMSAS